MGLYELWKEDPSQIRGKRVDQIIGFAGDGKLGDKNTAPAEFRAFLARVPTDMLARYAEECLAKSFVDSGLALQDIVNEMASRLGFTIEYGRYRGTKNEIGHDGIWSGPEGHNIVAEVKTSDAYRMPIETVASYRSELINKGRISEDGSSILVIVGREDTGELEAQIRGSRHAWDVRLISVDALVRLLHIRQEVDDPGTEARIRSLLVPREYTRIDEIIDLVFSTTEDLLEASPPDEGEANGERQDDAEPRDKPVSFNDAVAARLSNHLSVDLTKQSRVIFADVDAGVTVMCAVSKEYSESKGLGYWFAFHPHQLEKLEAASTGYAAFGCGSADQIALFPVQFIKEKLEGMNQTNRDDGRSYWHIQIHFDGNAWILHRRKDEDWPDITDKMVLSNGP
jgi:hypothetical protein